MYVVQVVRYGAYAAAARRRVYLATVLLRLCLSNAQADAKPVISISMNVHIHSIPEDGSLTNVTMKFVGAPSAWSSHPDIGKKESAGRDPPQRFAPHAHRGVVGAHELCR